jgi:hypothetical protein
MNKARIKLLIRDIRDAEKEILSECPGGEERELLGELKAAVDDVRLTVWSALVTPGAGPLRQKQVQSVRMTRVVDMLRQINRDKRPAGANQKPFTFSELMKVAEQALNESHIKPHPLS